MGRNVNVGKKVGKVSSTNQLLLAIVLGVFTGGMAGCSKSSPDVNPKNLVEWNGQAVDRKIESDGVQFRVVSKSVLAGGDLAGQSRDAGGEPETKLDVKSTASTASTALVLGFPRQLIGEQHVFGAVITGVSNTKNEELGALKLSDIDPLNVSSRLSVDGNFLVLNGCVRLCDEWSERPDLLRIPVVKSDADFVYLDLSTFGSALDFLQLAYPTAGVSAIATKVPRFDFSLSTLVFDVENTYKNDDLGAGDPGGELTLTVRWYMKLSSAFHSDFISRKARSEVGFFTTSRNAVKLVTRFPGSANGKAIAKYYIKNVPKEHRKAFADAFEDWNQRLKPVLGRDILEYEFLESEDVRSKQITTGDVRFNVLEWDLVNKAGYGGLGPSIANQGTGETFSANVLIQGPTVIRLYSKWWKVAAEAEKLEKIGLPLAAEALKASFMASLKSMQRSGAPAYKVSLRGSEHLAFNIRSGDPRLRDSALDEMDFLERPQGYDYETYMYGYFRDMIAHELGHNLGLRHNFKGNLGASDNGEIGSASRSIMEYLGRTHRHLDRVGDYDVMAMGYGYRGLEPKHADWFCTDEDKVSAAKFENSAECSSNDATKDPFGFMISRYQRAKEFLIMPGSELAPVWTVPVLKKQIVTIVEELAGYYVSSFSTAKAWTNFSNHASADKASEYILKTLVAEFCDPKLEVAIAKKTTEAQAVARKNVADLRDLIKTTTAAFSRPNNGFNDQNFACFK